MSEYSSLHGLDELDVQILALLQTDASISNADLSRRLSLSPPAVHNRRKRLEQAGYVRGYVALLDRELLGFDLMCFVQVSMVAHHRDRIAAFEEAIASLPEVLECHHLTGEYDFLLKVVVLNRKALERLLVEKLSIIPGVARMQTGMVLREVKAITAIPVE